MLLDPRLPDLIRRAFPYLRKEPVMSDPVLDPVPAGPGKVETKTKFGALGAYLGAVLLLGVLTSSSSDLVNALPDWLETIVYPALPAATAFLAAYVKSHRPGLLSRSARVAARSTGR